MNLRDIFGKRAGNGSEPHEPEPLFGYAEVTAAQARAIFDDVIAPKLASLGLQEIKGMRWGAQRAQEIVQLVDFFRGKGMYSFQWGVSLGWIPRDWDTKPKWHRTMKSAQFDLWEPTYTPDMRSSRVGLARVDAMRGEAGLREALDRLLPNLIPHVREWLAVASTPEGVLETARNQTYRRWDGGRHHPSAELVYALTLARVGTRDEATRALDACRLEPDELSALRKIVESILPA
jgi:hypothetical protein